MLHRNGLISTVFLLLSLFVLLYLFFWPLCCLFFFDILILITPLVSSNSSWKLVQNNYLTRDRFLSSQFEGPPQKTGGGGGGGGGKQFNIYIWFYNLCLCSLILWKFVNWVKSRLIFVPVSGHELDFTGCLLTFLCFVRLRFPGGVGCLVVVCYIVVCYSST
jgi:hypothetical protein